MANGIIAGIFTIAGLVIGVLLEPVKAVLLERTRARQERADRCAAMLEAVTIASTWIVGLNRQFRDEAAGRPAAVAPAVQERLTSEFAAARQNMRKTVWLLRLSGPEKLAEAAEQLRRAERRLRDLRLEPDDDQSVGPDAVPRAIRDARVQLDKELANFADVARRSL